QGHGEDQRAQRSVQYLLRHAPLGNDLEHLCWARLALEVHRDQPGVADALPSLEDRIRAAYQERATTSYVRSNPLREALTALALAAPQHNLFHLSAEKEASANPRLADNTTPEGIAPKPRQSLGDKLKTKFNGLVIEALGRLKPLPLSSAVHIAPATD